MTAPSYTEDLTDLDLAEATTNWAESSDGSWDDGGTPTLDTDYPYLQGNGAISQTMTKTTICSLMANYGSGISLPTDGAYFVWQNWMSPTGLNTYASGGIRIMVGSGTGAFKWWAVGGSDRGRNPYGGWQNNVVNPTISADGTVGSPTSTEQYVGSAMNPLSAPSKGNPHQVDAIRFGRGSSIFEYGDVANGYCTFAGFAAQNDAVANRWGLIQAAQGGYLYKGKLTLGTTSNPCDFRDANVLVLIDDTPKVTTNFNTLEVNNASSRIDWSNVIFKALGTQSPGRLVCNANADLNWDACQFFNMGAFTLGGSGSELLNCIWNACGLITVAGGKINGSKIITPTVAADASAVGWDVATNPDGYLDDLTISRGANAHHAIGFGTSSPSSITIRGLTATGFNAANGQNDSTFYIADSNTGNSYTISCVGCSGNMTYKTAGASVTIVQDPVTVRVTVTDVLGNTIDGARVLVKASNATGPFPYQESITISNSGTTATVTHTGHGMATNDHVLIEGASLLANNGVHQITKISDNSYSYTMSSSPGSSPTGTITATFVALYGTTSGGVVSTSRVYSSDQPVTGWARKASGTPYYKPGPIVGPVDSTDGLNATAVMIVDE
jgi:hypothetical protein